MRSKVLVPVVLMSLGVFSTTMFFGCSSDSPKGSGTGGKGGATATGGKSGTGGSASGGSGSGGTGTGGSETGGAGGTSVTGGAGGTADSGGAGGTSAGGAGGGTAGAAGNAGGAAGMAATGGRGMMGGPGGHAGAGGGSVGGAGGGSVGGAGGGATWPKTMAACMTIPAASPADFCAYYDTTCGSMYSPATGHFASAADCMTRYMTYTDAQKKCASYHVCNAGTPNGAAAHCLHPAGGGGDPCMLP